MRLEKSWAERLAEAEACGYFTEEDKGMIENFDTCFIGEHYYGVVMERLDYEEIELGHMATRAVLLDRVAQAREIYEKVQLLYEQPRPLLLSGKQ